MGDQLINDQDFNSQIYNHVKLIGVEKTVAVKKVGKGEKHVFNQPFMMRAYIEKLMYATKLSNCYIFLVLQQLLRAKENCQLMLHCPKIQYNFSSLLTEICLIFQNTFTVLDQCYALDFLLYFTPFVTYYSTV